MKELWPAILLAWIAGFVDSLGYLELSHVFTAHMSGNAAALGAHVGQGDWHEAMIRGMAIPPFVFGVALGVMAEATVDRRNPRAQLVPAFIMELACLGAFLLLRSFQRTGSPPAGQSVPLFPVCLLAVAMGLQSATLRRVGETRIRTTYVSGMLTNMTENGVRYLIYRWRHRAGSVAASTPSKPYGRLTATFGLIFVAFIVGGACGGFGQMSWGPPSLLAPIMCLLVLTLQDWLSGRW